jgi:hypothetical protein
MASQYLAMVVCERRAAVADVYRRLAAVEEKHAAFWEQRLRAAGHPVGARRPTARARVLGWVARRFGASVVLPTIAGGEYAQRNDYLAHPETHGTGMVDEERLHARVLGNVLAKSSALSGCAVGRIEGRRRKVEGNDLRTAVFRATTVCARTSA